MCGVVSNFTKRGEEKRKKKRDREKNGGHFKSII
jgi:hypothetical protein